MAYTDSQIDQTRRQTAIIGVVAIHAALGYALVSGLAMEAVTVIRDQIDVYDVKPTPTPTPPPPTPTPQATSEPQTSKQVVTPPIDNPIRNNNPIDSIRFDPNDIVIADPGPIVLPDPGPPQPLPKATVEPKPSPTFSPKPVSPSNDKMSWVTTADYPSVDMRRGNEGTTAYRLVIGTDGKVNSCDVTRSSGFERLDEAACKALKRRARFNAASDASGKTTTGTYTGTVTWRIPD